MVITCHCGRLSVDGGRWQVPRGQEGPTGAGGSVWVSANPFHGPGVQLQGPEEWGHLSVGVTDRRVGMMPGPFMNMRRKARDAYLTLTPERSLSRDIVQ